MSAKSIIKKTIIYSLFNRLRDRFYFKKLKKRYLKADEINLFVNNSEDNEKYLILEYSGKSGLMTQMLIVIGWLKFAKEYGYKLIVDMCSGENMYKTDFENAWEKFFYQPMDSVLVDEATLKDIKQNKNYAICNSSTRVAFKFYLHGEELIKKYPPVILFPLPRDYLLNKQLHKEWEKTYSDFIKVKPNIQEYFDKEYNDILLGKSNVLGVLVRGTDYSATKPYMHPIQPTATDVIEKIKEISQTIKIDYIYLATDEYATEVAFRKQFGNMVLVNKREYYDGATTWLCDIKKERDNDEFLRGLEYFSSMNLLSKCDYFVSGLNGGEQGTLIMNQSKFKFVYLFDTGDYK